MHSTVLLFCLALPCMFFFRGAELRRGNVSFMTYFVWFRLNGRRNKGGMMGPARDN